MHVLDQLNDVLLALLQLAPLLVPLVDHPQIVDAQLGLDVLLAVERDERHLVLLVANEVQRLLDFVHDRDRLSAGDRRVLLVRVLRFRIVH